MRVTLSQGEAIAVKVPKDKTRKRIKRATAVLADLERALAEPDAEWAKEWELMRLRYALDWATQATEAA